MSGGGGGRGGGGGGGTGLVVAAIVTLLPAAALGGLGGLSAADPAAPGAFNGGAPSAVARTDIPAALLPLYEQAAAGCPGLGWPVLAGVGKLESNHDRPAAQVSASGARGPMRFLPASWARYGTDGDGDGRRDVDDPADAFPAAAADLCDHDVTGDVLGALASYHCGAVTACVAAAKRPGGYAIEVLTWANRYATLPPVTATSTGSGAAGSVAAAVAVQAALAQVGTPYLWGGESSRAGFDCSGLVQFAYRQAGLTLPRTAQTQYDRGPHLDPGITPEPGDLVFFGSDHNHVHHVGLSLGQGRMVDAPHTGAFVRVEPVAGFGDYLGATRPTAAPVPGDTTAPATLSDQRTDRGGDVNGAAGGGGAV